MVLGHSQRVVHAPNYVTTLETPKSNLKECVHIGTCNPDLPEAVFKWSQGGLKFKTCSCSEQTANSLDMDMLHVLQQVYFDNPKQDCRLKYKQCQLQAPGA